MLFTKAGIHNILVRIANREDPFLQAISVQNFRKFSVITLYMFQHSFIQAYCILFKANPKASLLNVMGDWPISSMSCRTFCVTSGLVNGAGIISTSGTKYGGFIWNKNARVLISKHSLNVKMYYFLILQL